MTAASCHQEDPGGHRESPAHDCQKDLCAHLQAAVNQSRSPDLDPPFPAPAFAFHSEGMSNAPREGVSARAGSKAPARDLGPPVPPSLFTVLRA